MLFSEFYYFIESLFDKFSVWVVDVYDWLTTSISFAGLDTGYSPIDLMFGVGITVALGFLLVKVFV